MTSAQASPNQSLALLVFRKDTSPPEVLDGTGWTLDECRAWLTAHGYRSDQLSENDVALKFPQQPLPAATVERFALDGSAYNSQTGGYPWGVSALELRSRVTDPRERPLELGHSSRSDARLELRTEPGRPPRVRGYAAVFDRETELWPGYREVIRPGAFTAALKGSPDVPALFNHNDDLPLARTTVAEGAGSLSLWQDTHGLGFDMLPLDTEAGRTVIEGARTGVLTGASFAFVATEAPENIKKDHTLREVFAADLFDVSPVTYPAYPEASIALRALTRADQELTGPELVSRLTAYGLTRGKIREMLDSASATLRGHSAATPRRESQIEAALALARERLDV